MARNVGIKGDECQCGRRASIRHCTLCGSTRYYGFSQEQWRERLDGTPEKVKLFRCLSCSHKYTDAEREFCDAPPVSNALARQKLAALAQAKQQGEYLRPDDEKLAETIAKILPTNVNPVVRLKNTWFALRNAYIDAKLTQPMQEFLQEQLTSINMPQNEIGQILQWQSEVDNGKA